jgi:hypothetical protein
MAKQILKGLFVAPFIFDFAFPLPFIFKARRLQGRDSCLQIFHLLLRLFQDRTIILHNLYEGIKVSMGARVGHKKIKSFPAAFCTGESHLPIWDIPTALLPRSRLRHPHSGYLREGHGRG